VAVVVGAGEADDPADELVGAAVVTVGVGLAAAPQADSGNSAATVIAAKAAFRCLRVKADLLSSGG
jgi:hypothetical protein